MSGQQRLVLVVCILASFVAFLDGSVVSVGLPAISRSLGGGLPLQQWVVDANLLTLGSLILVAGSLSDLFGRKRILTAGLVGFAITSVLCAIAPSGLFLVISRALQGAAGALLVPSSLALIISAFSGPAQGRAIGLWTGWTTIAFVVGPLLGGFLVDAGSWRLIFAINLLPIAVTLWLMRRIKFSERRLKKTPVDSKGAVLGILGLGGPVFALIEQAHYGWTNPIIYLPLLGGVMALAYFVRHEQRTLHPMLPLSLFKVRNFSVGNVATLAVYGALGVTTLLITVFVQEFGGYSALQAGMAFMPVTIIMFILSPRFGALAGRYGPRLFMAMGPMISGLGFLWMLLVDQSVNYWSQLLPGIVVFGLGLSMTVAPLTSAVLSAINKHQAGIGSAANNAVSRIAGLVTIAGIGVATGPELDLAGFHRGIIMTAALLILGGVISAVGIRNQPTLN